MEIENESNPSKEPLAKKNASPRKKRGKQKTQQQKELWRVLGRKVVIAGQINILIALFLPWINLSGFGINAFDLSSLESAISQKWLLSAIWGIPFLAFLASFIILLDTLRPLSKVPAITAFIIGAIETSFASYVFITELALRQLGATACFVGGCMTAYGGFYLLLSIWTPVKSWSEAKNFSIPWCTLFLITLNIAIFFVLSFRDDYFSSIVREYGLIGGSLKWYAFTTSLFLHGSWYHVLCNMLFLGSVGVLLERKIGWFPFLIVFFIAGIGGSLISILIDPRFYLPTIGASGAVAGLMACTCVVAPRQKVRLFFHFLVTVGWIWLPAIWLFAIWFVLQSLSTFLFALGDVSNVAYWAHIGGSIVGLLLGLILLKASLIREEPPISLSEEQEITGKKRVNKTRKPETIDILFPTVISSVSFGLCLIAIVITFTTSTLLGTITSFQRSWNTGDMTKVQTFGLKNDFNFKRQLDEIVNGVKQLAGGKELDYRIAMNRMRAKKSNCKVTFAAVPKGSDPYRSENAGKLVVEFEKVKGNWIIRYIELWPGKIK